jgi:hypothetical protein
MERITAQPRARFRSGLISEAHVGERRRTPLDLGGPCFAQIGGPKLRPELRLAALISDATVFGADLIERRFRRSEPIFHPAEDAGFEPARACTQPAFQASAIGL